MRNVPVKREKVIVGFFNQAIERSPRVWRKRSLRRKIGTPLESWSTGEVVGVQEYKGFGDSGVRRRVSDKRRRVQRFSALVDLVG
jgi:hypothetical protein